MFGIGDGLKLSAQHVKVEGVDVKGDVYLIKAEPTFWDVVRVTYFSRPIWLVMIVPKGQDTPNVAVMTCCPIASGLAPGGGKNVYK